MAVNCSVPAVSNLEEELALADWYSREDVIHLKHDLFA